MNAEEFDASLADLETRVDRLRALYENWFRGYEKSEPFVARKEVERRVYALRKDLPRNTALRFRYHQLFQRYTTLTSYWQRTARQIEEGTHRLQLQRLRRRRSDEGMGASLPPRPATESEAPPPAAFELNLDETLDVQSLLDEADFDQVASALERGGAARAPQPAVPPATSAATPVGRAVGRFARPSAANDALQRPSLSFDLGDGDERAAASLLPGSLRSGVPSAPAPAGPLSKAPPMPLDKLPEVPKAPRMPVGPIVTPPMMTNVPSVSLSPPSAGAAGLPARPPALGGPSLPPGQASAASLPPGRSAAPRPPAPPVPGTPSRAAPPPLGQRPPPPPVPSITARAPTTGSMPLPPSAGRPMPPPPRPSLPNTTSAANVAPSPTPSAPPRKPVPAPAPTGPTFTEQRMRRIYDEYAAARKKNNEGEVRFETLAGSIQKMLPDLHKKHQGKQIDFEVVVKDGRVGLKPRAT